MRSLHLTVPVTFASLLEKTKRKSLHTKLCWPAGLRLTARFLKHRCEVFRAMFAEQKQLSKTAKGKAKAAEEASVPLVLPDVRPTGTHDSLCAHMTSISCAVGVYLHKQL